MSPPKRVCCRYATHVITTCRCKFLSMYKLYNNSYISKMAVTIPLAGCWCWLVVGPRTGKWNIQGSTPLISMERVLGGPNRKGINFHSPTWTPKWVSTKIGLYHSTPTQNLVSTWFQHQVFKLWESPPRTLHEGSTSRRCGTSSRTDDQGGSRQQQIPIQYLPKNWCGSMKSGLFNRWEEFPRARSNTR